MRSVPQNHTRPVWAEISASALRSNFQQVRSAAGQDIDILAVIKADAYGHGAVDCAPVLAGAGAGWLGVTSTEEGAAVRAALGILPQGMAPRVLVMCGVWAGEEAACLDCGLTPVVWEHYHLDLLEREARRRGAAPQSVAVHVEVDTGMARQGVVPGLQLERLLHRFTAHSPLLLEGVLTHLASTEVVHDAQNARQMALFAGALGQVLDAGLRPRWVHAGNTSSTDSGLVPRELPALAAAAGARAMTRAGLALYGYALPLAAEPAGHPRLGGLRTAMTWKTRIVSVREVMPGDTVGYNATFVAERPMRLALLPVGYADGFRRGLSAGNGQPRGEVVVRGQRVPVTGRVSMDLTVIDVSEVPAAAIGDEVVLLGWDGCAFVGADEHAALAGTSVYEVLCGISDRVLRVVVEA